MSINDSNWYFESNQPTQSNISTSDEQDNKRAEKLKKLEGDIKRFNFNPDSSEQQNIYSTEDIPNLFAGEKIFIIKNHALDFIFPMIFNRYKYESEPSEKKYWDKFIYSTFLGFWTDEGYFEKENGRFKEPKTLAESNNYSTFFTIEKIYEYDSKTGKMISIWDRDTEVKKYIFKKIPNLSFVKWTYGEYYCFYGMLVDDYIIQQEGFIIPIKEVGKPNEIDFLNELVSLSYYTQQNFNYFSYRKVMEDMNEKNWVCVYEKEDK